MTMTQTLKQARDLLTDRVDASERRGCGSASHSDILAMAFEVVQLFPELIVDPEANPEVYDVECYEGEWLVPADDNYDCAGNWVGSVANENGWTP